MPTGDVYKVSLFSHTTQRQVINTHYYQAGSAAPTDPFEEAQALAEAFDADVLTAYQTALSSDVSFGCSKVEKVLGSEIPTYVSFYTNMVGSEGAGAQPPNIVGIIRRRGADGNTMLRSLLFITGISNTNVLGSFLTAAFISGAFSDLINVLNNVLTSSGTFQNATWEPVIPHTDRVYARNIDCSVDVSANTVTRNDAINWADDGFLGGPGFRILAPNRNRGSYVASVPPASTVVTLAENSLEVGGNQVMSFQQATAATAYFPLQSTIPQTALRQLNRRRSSHTGIVA